MLEHLLHEKRVPIGAAVDGIDKLGWRVGSAQMGQQLTDRLAGEHCQMQPLCLLLPNVRPALSERRIHVGLGVPVRGEDDHGEAGKVGCEMLKHVHRRFVGPLQIVHEDRDGRRAAQRTKELKHTVRQVPAKLLRRQVRRAVEVGEHARELGLKPKHLAASTVECPAQRVAGGVSARIVQNLDKGGKGLVALALVAAPLERDHATVACGRHCLVRETRLSYAWLAADQEQRSGPSESFLHRLVELVELFLTAD